MLTKHFQAFNLSQAVGSGDLVGVLVGVLGEAGGITGRDVLFGDDGIAAFGWANGTGSRSYDREPAEVVGHEHGGSNQNCR